MRFIDETIYVLLPIISLLALVVGGINYAGRYSCDNYTVMTGRETKFVNFDDCYVKTDRGFQRWDEYKARIIASERGSK